jgi:hypothetical protein
MTIRYLIQADKPKSGNNLNGLYFVGLRMDGNLPCIIDDNIHKASVVIW